MTATHRSRAARRRRWVVPLPGATIVDARTTFVDRCPPSLILGALIVVSALAHGLGVDALRGVRAPARAARPAEPVHVAVIEKAPQPPPPPRLQPAVAPKPVVPMMPRRRIAVAHPSDAPPPTVTPPKLDLPPPPGAQDAVPELAPTLLPGVALSATTVSGSMSVARGGGATGRPGGESAGPGQGKSSQGTEVAPDYALMEQPLFLENVSADQVRSFYPEAAVRDRFEAAVKLKLLIDSDGSVARAVALKDPGYGMAAAAARLARLYRFTAPRMNGRPVATEIVFTIRFELTE